MQSDGLRMVETMAATLQAKTEVFLLCFLMDGAERLSELTRLVNLTGNRTLATIHQHAVSSSHHRLVRKQRTPERNGPDPAVVGAAGVLLM